MFSVPSFACPTVLLSIGDRILEVGNVSVAGLSHTDVINLFSTAGNNFFVTVARGRDADNQVRVQSTERLNTLFYLTLTFTLEVLHDMMLALRLF